MKTKALATLTKEKEIKEKVAKSKNDDKELTSEQETELETFASKRETELLENVEKEVTNRKEKYDKLRTDRAEQTELIYANLKKKEFDAAFRAEDIIYVRNTNLDEFPLEYAQGECEIKAEATKSITDWKKQCKLKSIVDDLQPGTYYKECWDGYQK